MNGVIAKVTSEDGYENATIHMKFRGNVVHKNAVSSVILQLNASNFKIFFNVKTPSHQILRD